MATATRSVWWRCGSLYQLVLRHGFSTLVDNSYNSYELNVCEVLHVLTSPFNFLNYWDFGGQENTLRPYWRHHLTET
ncbi:hypothetical protein KXD40_006168 [Peronospora effusa]|uniref:Uncharacterized protein n=1 Tax=Peronospora effusa TaxID=542832 RepID=A0A3M6VET2_9STRA|nr:hypothetical protein DD238_005788 [Peronospora effusa]RQM12733.1 hypothetical protein DD237_006112 [Peronospora effusa]UIZ25911.1 hypothetical protein KXD40_006168 [Peronospora effusa]